MKDYLYFLMEELWTELSGDEWSCRHLFDLEMEMETQLKKIEWWETEEEKRKELTGSTKTLIWFVPSIHVLLWRRCSRRSWNPKTKLKGKVISEEEKEEIWR